MEAFPAMLYSLHIAGMTYFHTSIASVKFFGAWPLAGCQLQRYRACVAADLDWNDVGKAVRACDDFVAQVAGVGELVEEATDPESDSDSSRASASSEED